MRVSNEIHERPEWDRTNLALLISHRAPFARGEHALLCRLGLVTEDLLDKLRIGPNALEEHEVRAERLLGGIGVLDVALAGLARLALGGAVRVLALDVVGGEGAHVRGELALSGVLEGLGATTVGLGWQRDQSQSIEDHPEKEFAPPSPRQRA